VLVGKGLLVDDSTRNSEIRYFLKPDIVYNEDLKTIINCDETGILHWGFYHEMNVAVSKFI
jgi:hypothetical protein